MKMHTHIYRVAITTLLLGMSPLAFAHAVLVRSTPADQSVVHGRNVAMTLEYNSRIEATRCTLTLTGPNEKNLPVHMESSTKPAELKATASNLANGNYRIHWQVLASDGHITRGDISFSVAAK